MLCRQFIVLSLGRKRGEGCSLPTRKGRAAGELRIAAAVQILDAFHIQSNDLRGGGRRTAECGGRADARGRDDGMGGRPARVFRVQL